MKPTIADVLAARTREPSPGRVFTDAFAAEGFSACAEYQVTITDSLVSSRRKPRYPARNMFKITDLSRELRRCYWYETPRLPEDPEIPGGDLRRELTHRFGMAPVPDLLPSERYGHEARHRSGLRSVHGDDQGAELAHLGAAVPRRLPGAGLPRAPTANRQAD